MVVFGKIDLDVSSLNFTRGTKDYFLIFLV